MKGDMSDKVTPISCCCQDGNDLNGRLKYIAVLIRYRIGVDRAALAFIRYQIGGFQVLG